MKRSVFLASAIALALSSTAFAQDATTSSSMQNNLNGPAANSGTSQTGPGDGMGSMGGSTSQYQNGGSADAGQQPLPDQGNAPSNRKNTDYGTLEPGKADTNPGVSQPVTTRNADTTETHAPLKGANSFTQAEATRRLEHAGYSRVSGLAKDDQSVWRGTAMKGDQQVAVALDYKGQITDASK